MIIELKRLINSGLGTKCIPPMESGAMSQNTSMFIYRNNTWSTKSRSKSFTFSVFPLTSPKISMWGSYGSSRIASLVAELLPLVSLGMVYLKCLNFWVDWGRLCNRRTKISGSMHNCRKFKISLTTKRWCCLLMGEVL